MTFIFDLQMPLDVYLILMLTGYGLTHSYRTPNGSSPTVKAR